MKSVGAIAVIGATVLVSALMVGGALRGEDFPKPYSPPCTERENVFEFADKPSVRSVGSDRYQITFAVKWNCDVTVAAVDAQGRTVRHLASGVLGANAPAPFQKNSLKQTVTWNGKDDLAEYVKEPRKLSVRVQLGLKPSFHRLLGGADPHDLPGVVIGLAIGADGAYVFSKGGGMHDHACLRKFDHDGNYLRSLAPPPSDLPWDRLNGCGYVEYEPGKRALHGPKVIESLAGDGFWLVGLNAGDVSDLQPALAGGRLFYLNGGSGYFQGRKPSALHYVFTDGGTDVPGTRGRPFLWPDTSHTNARLAASPDGKWLYMINPGCHAVFRAAVEGDGAVEAFPGGPVNRKKRSQNTPGSDDAHFNNPTGIDCDAHGRVYVSDCANSRLQVFSPDLKLLKTIKVDRPNIVRVHQRTGAIYLFRYALGNGRTVPRLSKLLSFDNPRVEFSVDGIPHGMMAVDSWTPKPRLWIGGQAREGYSSSYEGIYHVRSASVTVWEEEGGTLKKILDFDEVARKQAGAGHVGGWSSSVFDHVNCDPTREQLYWRGFRADPWVIDLETGRKLKQVHMPGSINDVGFDKRGYLHMHLNPGFFVPGVVRVNPAGEKPFGKRSANPM